MSFIVAESVPAAQIPRTPVPLPASSIEKGAQEDRPEYKPGLSLSRKLENTLSKNLDPVSIPAELKRPWDREKEYKRERKLKLVSLFP